MRLRATVRKKPSAPKHADLNTDLRHLIVKVTGIIPSLDMEPIVQPAKEKRPYRKWNQARMDQAIEAVRKGQNCRFFLD